MQNQTVFSHPNSMFKMSQSLVVGAKEKLAASFTLFLGCFLAGLSTGSLLCWGSGVSGGQAGTETVAGTRGERQPGVGFSLFTGTGTPTFSSWVRIIISEGSCRCSSN